jgi:dimethylsulfide dehydrogenase subunit gamma/complex iron-sulfur molybdoenzyme family reductase subunit gamma
MNTSNRMKQLALFGLATATASLALTAMAAPTAPAAPHMIRVLSVAGADAASPEADVWKKTPATQVALQPAFAGHSAIVGTPVTEQLNVQAVRAGDRLFMKLSWSDRTTNSTIKDTTAFMDGAAVQFPVNGKASTIPFMGDPKAPVNVWHWRADGRTESLVAHGFGSATRLPFDGLKSTAVRTDSGWAVVLTRTLKVKANEGASLHGKGTMPIAFAVWDGENQERDGLKAVTLEWWQLRF